METWSVLTQHSRFMNLSISGFHSIVCPHQWRLAWPLESCNRNYRSVSIQLFAPINGDSKDLFFWISIVYAFPFNCLPPSMETQKLEDLGSDSWKRQVSIQLFAPINGDRFRYQCLKKLRHVSFHSIVCPHQWRPATASALKAVTGRMPLPVSIQLFAPINGDSLNVSKSDCLDRFPFNCLPPSMETRDRRICYSPYALLVSIQLFAPINGDSKKSEQVVSQTASSNVSIQLFAPINGDANADEEDTPVYKDGVSIQLFAPINGDFKFNDAQNEIIHSFPFNCLPPSMETEEEFEVKRRAYLARFHSIVCPHQWRQII